MRTFNDVMQALPFDAVWELLNSPREIDRQTFLCLVNWCRPKRIEAETFIDAAVECGMFATRGEVHRKLKERALKWNGSQVLEVNQPIKLLEPGWGVIQMGKKQHTMVISCDWIVRSPE